LTAETRTGVDDPGYRACGSQFQGVGRCSRSRWPRRYIQWNISI